MRRVVVITGMGRSGTSLAASLLQRAGLDMGERLIDPGESNRRGYFEDADFVQFHERAFRDRQTYSLADSSFVFKPTEAEIEQAQRIVAARGDQALWSFKDPRASLFLDFWDEHLENAVYFFLCRHPLEVLISFLRYGEARASGLSEPIRAWEAYNARVLDFRARNPERCAIVHTYGFQDIDALNHVLHHKLGLDLFITPEMLLDLYRPGELHAGEIWAEQAFALIEPAAAAMYDELVRVADVPPPARDVTEEPRSLAAYRRAAAELLPELGSHRRGLLLSLVELVAPEIAERGMTAQLKWILELEEAKEWLDEQRLSWMSRTEALERRSVLIRIGRLVARLRRSS